MNDIRLIAMDLDGTLLQRDGSILPETLEALRAASNRGVTIALASGRYPENAALTFIDHQLNGPVMGANGAIIQDSPMGQTMFLHMIPTGIAGKVREYLDQEDCPYILFSHKRVTTSKVGMTHRSEINDGPRIERLGGIHFGHGPDAVDLAMQQGICKFYLFDHPRLNDLAQELRKIPHLLVTRSGEHNIELMPEGIHKGNGIRELCSKLGISLSQVMAFGDEENDLPMLTSVVYGFAMANAPEHVKRQCGYVTDSYQDNGIAHAVKQYVLSGGFGAV